MNRKDVRDILKSQAQNTQLEFEQRSKAVILQFAEQGKLFSTPPIKLFISNFKQHKIIKKENDALSFATVFPCY